MRRAILPFLFLVSFTGAFTAQAQLDAVRVYPPGPTSETPITLAIVSSCPRADSYRVEKRANEVLLIIKAVGSCPSPPIPVIDRYLSIGTLPAGSYRISYIFEGGDDIVRQLGRVIVRHASAPSPFEIHPFAVPVNPSGLRLRIEGTGDLAVCSTDDCSDTTIPIGGVAATNITRVPNSNAVFVDAPPHAAGLVDVAVEKLSPAITWNYTAALYYYDVPEMSVFERILLPVLFDAPGANGSLWRSEAVVANPNPWFVETVNKLPTGVVCISYPCGERLTPGAYVRSRGGNHPHGLTLLVPREAGDLDFALRVRDVSREAEGFGSEVPVVREKDLILDRPIRLLDVPLDAKYRVKVRVYSFDPPLGEAYAGVQVVTPHSSVVQATHQLRLTRDCFGEHCEFTPFYGELDLPAPAAGELVMLSINMPHGAESWAFATVTNNATQQVTVVTPQ